jgi:para-aminobenzoate synthetase component 1
MRSREFVSFPVSDFRKTKLQMLSWASQFDIFCFLDNHEYPFLHHSQECLLAAGARYSLEAKAGNAFEQLKEFSVRYKDWLFGHFGFDLKNETEKLSSIHPDGIEFPDLFFFVPEIIVELGSNQLRIGLFNNDHAAVFERIITSDPVFIAGMKSVNGIQARCTRSQYIETVRQLGLHILRGECYEINFCQEFYADAANCDPIQLYLRLSKISPAPFAAFYRLKEKWLLCASPERFLKRTGNILLSQPIKGTRTRNTQDNHLDQDNREELFNSGKDRSENVMIVDLVRNDLSKVCVPGSVAVEELYGIYSFPQVHQMISSVCGVLDVVGHWTEIIKATFPMGSMTGAPKKRVLELIEQYEQRKRGLFSGAVGYIAPNEDFDFNVVIRSILINQRNRYLSYQAGSAITFYSEAQQEYEECLLKVAAIKKVLTA